MRSRAGLLFAALLVFAPGVIAGPADATGGTTCQAIKGNATFKPALPKLGASNKVLSSVSVANGTITGCTGGGVTSGSVRLNSKFSKPGNCATLATAGSTNPTKGTETIAWNIGKSSTIAVTLTGVNGQPTQAKVTGTVTAGLFKGSKQSGTVGYMVPKGGCTAKALSTVTVKAITLQIIR